ncbi:Oidioi.mRNA.OKI2018_I69.PAR.g10668.t1.cds [Oikopleura dioica]|uniref:Oidioi.mRNA.OKI2018_I69.PAR.g10668.t1.cds n=1 Tax=Oikopleura dioica TaxID=34765 RepID=A0ABN7RS29_OIKDI|nr:Oidioi.mRNA.OKI2018_I69.PAR.g10668.t1.cds [Oikopleura dioica]
MIDDCQIKEIDLRLGLSINFQSAAVTMADQESALICFENQSFKKCEEFNGSDVVSRPSTTYSHDSACMGIHERNSVVVGSFEEEGANKVEKFNGTSWTKLPDHPKALNGHSCIGVEAGMLVLGGFDNDEDSYNVEVFLLRDAMWTIVGQLNKFHWFSSPLKIGKFIYLVSGYEQPFPVEELQWNGTEVTNAKVIGNNCCPTNRPIIFQVDEFYCFDTAK